VDYLEGQRDTFAPNIHFWVGRVPPPAITPLAPYNMVHIYYNIFDIIIVK